MDFQGSVPTYSYDIDYVWTEAYPEQLRVFDTQLFLTASEEQEEPQLRIQVDTLK
uniref:C-C motif chemokine receptor 5 n=1 Tax=Mus musculus TaxID=10090 RepID=E9Q351_MOUSE